MIKMGGKTKRNPPTACRGLNKTNCIFPCEYVKRKMNEQIGYCRSKYKRMLKHVTTEKQKKMLKMEHSKTMKKLNKAKSDIVKGTNGVESATKNMSMVETVTNSISNLFKPKEPVPVMEKEPGMEGMEIKEEVIEPVVEQEIKEEELKKEEENK